MTSPQIATRVRKARGNSVCGLCDVGIEIGNQIGKVPGVPGWSHVSCIVAAQRENKISNEGKRP